MNLEDEAQRLLAQGRVAEAEQAFDRLLESAPDNVGALNAVALSAARTGDLPRALTLIERAVHERFVHGNHAIAVTHRCCRNDCRDGGTHTVGQTCTPTDDCGPGLVCTVSGTATAGTCKKWCRVGTNDCGGTTACNGFQTKIAV